MRISHTTPSFDPLTPAWDQQKNLPDGSFMEYGGIAVSRWNYHITYCLRSAVPRSHVVAVGRCLSPKKRKADYLSMRVGADPARYLLLNTETTLYITVDANMNMTTTRRKTSQEDFMQEWGDILRDLEQKHFEVKAGMLSVLDR